jgi:hypothetical protein
MLHRLTGDSMGLLRLLWTRLRFLRPGLLGLGLPGLARRLSLLRLRCFLLWLLGLRGALLGSRLLSVRLWSWLLRVLLRLFLFPLVATFMLSVNRQQGPEKQKDCGRTRCSDDSHID